MMFQGVFPALARLMRMRRMRSPSASPMYFSGYGRASTSSSVSLHLAFSSLEGLDLWVAGGLAVAALPAGSGAHAAPTAAPCAAPWLGCAAARPLLPLLLLPLLLLEAAVPWTLASSDAERVQTRVQAPPGTGCWPRNRPTPSGPIRSMVAGPGLMDQLSRNGRIRKGYYN